MRVESVARNLNLSRILLLPLLFIVLLVPCAFSVPGPVEHDWDKLALPKDICEDCPPDGSLDSRMFLDLKIMDEYVETTLFVERESFDRQAIEDATIFVNIIPSDDSENSEFCRILTDEQGVAVFDYSGRGCETTGCTLKFIFCCANITDGCLIPICVGDSNIATYMDVAPCDSSSTGPWPTEATIDGSVKPVYPAIDEVTIDKDPDALDALMYFELCLPVLVIFGLLSAAMFASGRNPFQMFSLYNVRFKRAPERMMRARGRTWNIKAMASSVAGIAMSAFRIKKGKDEKRLGKEKGELGGVDWTGVAGDGFLGKAGLKDIGGRIRKARLAAKGTRAGARGDRQAVMDIKGELDALNKGGTGSKVFQISGGGTGTGGVPGVDTYSGPVNSSGGLVALASMGLNPIAQIGVMFAVMGTALAVKLLEGCGLTSWISYGAFGFKGLRERVSEKETETAAVILTRRSDQILTMMNNRFNAEKISGRDPKGDVVFLVTFFDPETGKDRQEHFRGKTEEEVKDKIEEKKLEMALPYIMLQTVAGQIVAVANERRMIEATEETADSPPEEIEKEAKKMKEIPSALIAKMMSNTATMEEGALVAAYVRIHGKGRFRVTLDKKTNKFIVKVLGRTRPVSTVNTKAKRVGSRMETEDLTDALVALNNFSVADAYSREFSKANDSPDTDVSELVMQAKYISSVTSTTYRGIYNEVRETGELRSAKGTVVTNNVLESANQHMNINGGFELEGRELLAGTSNLIPTTEKIQLWDQGKTQMNEMAKDNSLYASYVASQEYSRNATACAKAAELKMNNYAVTEAVERLAAGQQLNTDQLKLAKMATEVGASQGFITDAELAERYYYISNALTPFKDEPGYGKEEFNFPKPLTRDELIFNAEGKADVDSGISFAKPPDPLSDKEFQKALEARAYASSLGMTSEQYKQRAESIKKNEVYGPKLEASAQRAAHEKYGAATPSHEYERYKEEYTRGKIHDMLAKEQGSDISYADASAAAEKIARDTVWKMTDADNARRREGVINYLGVTASVPPAVTFEDPDWNQNMVLLGDQARAGITGGPVSPNTAQAKAEEKRERNFERMLDDSAQRGGAQVYKDSFKAEQAGKSPYNPPKLAPGGEPPEGDEPPTPPPVAKAPKGEKPPESKPDVSQQEREKMFREGELRRMENEMREEWKKQGKSPKTKAETRAQAMRSLREQRKGEQKKPEPPKPVARGAKLDPNAEPGSYHRGYEPKSVPKPKAQTATRAPKTKRPKTAAKAPGRKPAERFGRKKKVTPPAAKKKTYRGSAAAARKRQADKKRAREARKPVIAARKSALARRRAVAEREAAHAAKEQKKQGANADNKRKERARKAREQVAKFKERQRLKREKRERKKREEKKEKG